MREPFGAERALLNPKPDSPFFRKADSFQRIAVAFEARCARLMVTIQAFAAFYHWTLAPNTALGFESQMKTLASIQEELLSATSQTNDPVIKALAKVVEELCAHVHSIDRQAHLAADDARRALRLART
jgi:hypothetical protein